MRSKSYSIRLILFTGLLLFFYCNVSWSQNETTNSTVKKITLLYANEKHPTEKEMASFSQFTRKLIDDFPWVTNIQMHKWSNEDSFHGRTDKEIFNDLQLNAFYLLNISLSADEINTVEPILMVKNDKDASITKIVLPIYSIDYYQSYDFASFLMNELSGFVDSYYNENQGDKKAFLPDSFKWNTIYPMAKSASLNEDFSRSNFLLNLLMEKNSNLSDTDKLKVYYVLGNNKISQYRIEEAEEEFNKAIAIDPDDYWARFGTAKVMAENYNYDGAIRKTEGLVPATNEVYLLKGRVYMLMKQFDDAERNLNNVSSKSKPKIYKSKLLLLGSIYIENEQSDKAYMVYKELYKLDSSDPDIAYLYSYFLGLKGFDEYNKKNYDSAIDLLLNASKMSNNIDAADYLRLSFIHERRFDEALEFIAIKIEEGEYNTYDIYLTHALDIRIIFIDTDSTAYKDQDDFGEEMLKAINLHIALNPDEPKAYFYKGNTLTRLGRGDEGIEQMEIAYGKNNLDKGVQIDLMELYLLNDKIAACEEFYYTVKNNNKGAKVKVPDRNQAIMNYLLITSLNLQKKDYKKPYKKLNKLFKSGVILDPWSYGSYLSWLENSNYDDESKTFLVELTNEMKKYNKKVK